MSKQKSFFANLISNPTSFSILVLSAVILIVWLDQRTPSTPGNTDKPAVISGGKPSAGQAGSGPVALKPPSFNVGDTPKILNAMDGSNATGKQQAPDLGGLLSGLEAKVAADPSDTGKRLLLAQTYNELGMKEKALTTLNALHTDQPDNARVNLTLASILSNSDQEKDLKESLQILNKLSTDTTVQQYLVDFYRGDALIRQQDHEGALKSWKASLASMPEADNRRAMLQQRIADLSKKENTNNKPVDKKTKG